MSSHSKLSPSARVRWGNCPGSVRESAKYPERPSGAAAIDGTHTHRLLEWCIENDSQPNIGATLSDHEGSFVVDEDRAERVSFALEYIEKREAEMGGFTTIAERKVDPAMLFFRSDLSGTVDVTILSSDGLHIDIIDYKDGMAPVEAVDNPQLEQYAFGVVAELMMKGPIHPSCKIRMTIIQPKLRFSGQSGIVHWELYIDQLMARQAVLAKQAADTDKPDAPLVPGEAQCKYCPHGGACSARANSVLETAGISFENLTPTADANSMTDDQIRDLINVGPMIKQMLEAAEEEALRRFSEGKPIAGLKQVRGRGTRSWALPESEMETKLRKFGVPKAALYKTSLVSPAQAEKLTWKKRGSEQVEKLTPKKMALMKDYIKTSDGKLTVVSENDPREAVGTFVFTGIDELPEFLK